MRVLVTGSTGPLVPDGAWPGGAGPTSAAGPRPRDVALWWEQACRTAVTGGPAGPVVETDHVDLASAGPGFLDAVEPVAPEVLAGVVPGPGGVEVPVAVRRDPRTGTVYADASQVPAVDDAGPRGGEEGPAGPLPARSSAAVGRLLALAAEAARSAGGRRGRVVLATGGARSHDAGRGLLRTLAGPGEEGRPVVDVLRAARRVLRDVDLVAAVATDAPLLGLHGASAALAARGVDDTVAQDLERRLGAVAHAVAAAVEVLDGEGAAPVGRDLLAAAAPRRLAGVSGTGSGGGAAFAVAALGGRLVPALRVVADAVGLDDRLAAADLAVVVADELGAHELGEGAVLEVAQRAARHAVPVVVVARSVVAGRREQAAAGLSGVYAWGQDPPQGLVGRVARTWSRA